MRYQSIDMIDAVVYTHAHADHIMGLDDLRRFNLMSGKHLDVWADEPTQGLLKAEFRLRFLLRRRRRPRSSAPTCACNLIDGPFQIGAAQWTPVPLIHGQARPRFRSAGWLIAPMLVRFPEESFPMLEGLDLLVLGALSPRKHPSHFTLGRGGRRRPTNRRQTDVFHAHRTYAPA